MWTATSVLGTPSGSVRAALASELAPTAVRRRQLVEHHAYTMPFIAPGAGHVQIRWYAGAKHHQVLLVSGSGTSSTVQQLDLRLALTSAGGKLLSRVRRANVTAEARFTPAGHPPVSAQVRFSLR